MQAVFCLLRIWSPKGKSWSQAFLAETVETEHENLVDVLNNSAQYSTILKGKNMSNVLANGIIFLLSNIQTPTERESIKMLLCI